MDKFNVKDSPPDTSRLEKLFLEEGLLMKIKKNEYLVQQNEKNNQIGFVVSGIFRLSHTDANGNTWIVGYSICKCPGLQEKLSFKEIAQFLGITPETLSRIRKKQLYNERS